MGRVSRVRNESVNPGRLAAYPGDPPKAIRPPPRKSSILADFPVDRLRCNIHKTYGLLLCWPMTFKSLTRSNNLLHTRVGLVYYPLKSMTVRLPTGRCAASLNCVTTAASLHSRHRSPIFTHGAASPAGCTSLINGYPHSIGSFPYPPTKEKCTSQGVNSRSCRLDYSLSIASL
jgi:hypothetical protein